MYVCIYLSSFAIPRKQRNRTLCSPIHLLDCKKRGVACVCVCLCVYVCVCVRERERERENKNRN